MPKYTLKQIEKYKRQKYISALNKCTNNLYKLYKNENTTYPEYKKKFIELKKQLDSLDEIRLDTEYLNKIKSFIENLYTSTILNSDYSDEDFIESKSSKLTELNRLQKMRNRTKYIKTKHKKIDFED